ncbi:pyridoxal-dependent decarboxylase [Crassisporium funariophilum]|nr:pyridoxal-dependent decarboxylase [Crassisporium funariophilum]
MLSSFSFSYVKHALNGIATKVGIGVPLASAEPSEVSAKSQPERQALAVTPILSSNPSLPSLFRGDSSLLLQQEVSITFKDSAQGHNSFFVADLSQIYKQHKRWVKYFPHIRPFYAVKCNPDPYILRLLAGLGTGFDCASIFEIKEVLKVLGSGPESGQRIVFANPCKFSADVCYAAQQGIRMSTFDNIDELEKTARFHPQSRLLLRILTDDSGSRFPLGQKYGAPLAAVPTLLKRARELHLDVIGVAFHVGSSCYNPDVFRDSIWRSRQVFDMGVDAGFTMTLLDIGGGFDDSLFKPGSNVSIFEEVATAVKRAILEYFPESSRPPGFEVIAEPGRFHVFPSFTYATSIIARRTPWSSICASNQDADNDLSNTRKALLMYYLSDGTYGGLANIHSDNRVAHPYVVSMGGSFEVAPDPSDLEASSLWGPTCDSIDVISHETMLPRSLRIGDWLGFPDMGAYTTCLATHFNGCEAGRVIHATGAGEDGELVYQILNRGTV